MRTEGNETKTCKEQAIAQDRMGPEVFWLDPREPTQTFFVKDPSEMREQEEYLELDDYIISSLPPREFSLRLEEAELKAMRAALRAANGGGESAAEFAKRMKGSF